MNQKSFKLIRSYLMDPQKFWGGATRQPTKLKHRLKFLAKKHGLGESRLIDEIVAMAVLRQRRRSSTVHISNIGSSGSHWLEYMLATIGNLLPVGEVYLPSAFWRRLEGIAENDRRTCLDAVYVAHCGTLGDEVLTAAMMNSAHIADLGRFVTVDTDAKKILLVRNPVDIVVSRTFRKDEYRQYVDKVADDHSYFLRNVEVVRQFFASAEPSRFDAVVRYEDLLGDGVRTLAEVARVLDIEPDEARLRNAVERNRDGVAPEVAALGRSGNRHTAGGKTANFDSYRRQAAELFGPLLGELGYPQSVPA